MVLLDSASGEQLSVIDIRSAERAREQRAVVLAVEARDGIAYIGTRSRGRLIYDISNPKAPTEIAQYVELGEGAPTSIWQVSEVELSPHRDRLYLVNDSPPTLELRVIDVSEPTSPQELGRHAMLADSFGTHVALVVDGQARRETIYASQEGVGLQILDTDDPTRISELGRWEADRFLSTGGAPFTVDGAQYYALADARYDGGLVILDISDPAAPMVVGRYRTRDGLVAGDVKVIDTTAYVAYHLDGLRVVELAQPAAPVEVAHYDTIPSSREKYLYQGASVLDFDDDRIYVSDVEGGVHAFARLDADN